MPWQSANPWRCWEHTTLPAILNGPENLLVRIALYDHVNHLYQSEFRFPALVRLGPNDYRGGYAQITLRFGQCLWSFEMAAEGDRILLLIRPLDPADAENVMVRLETLFLGDKPTAGRVAPHDRSVIATRGNQQGWRIWSPTASAHRSGTTIASPLIRPFIAIIEPLSDGAREHDLRSPIAQSDFTPAERYVVAAIAQARKDYLTRFNNVPRELWWMYSAIPYAIGWNTLWAANRQEPVQVPCRDWCAHGDFGDWAFFNADTFLIASAAADYDLELATQIIRPQLSFQTSDGMIPAIASPWGITADRSAPPAAALGLWKTYLRTNHRPFIEEFYEPLKRYHDWRNTARDGNKDGLLEWGSHPAAESLTNYPPPHSAAAARAESGLDNHPMWDKDRFNPQTNTLEQADPGLCALHAASALCLSKMANLLGQSDDAARFHSDAERLTRLLDSQLWQDKAGLWLSKTWHGHFIPAASPTCLYPLLLQHLPDEHLNRAVSDHLLNPHRFAGRYVLPLTPRDDPAYPDQSGARGRIGPLQTLLVHWALREAHREDAAAALALGCIETFKQEWLDEGHLHESYNAETSSGDDSPDSDPIHTTGLFLPLAAWSHFRDLRLDGSEARAERELFFSYLDRSGTLRSRVEPIEQLPPLD